MTTQPNSSSRRSTIIMSVMAVVIIVQFIKIYYDSREKQTLTSDLTSTEAELTATNQRLVEISAELDAKIVEVKRLGGEVTDLQKAKTEIEAELKRSKRATGKEIKALKDKVEGYELLLKNKDEEITKLKKLNNQLLSENSNLKTQKSQLGDSINRLSQTQEELASKVSLASQLRAENFRIVTVNDRGKERESPFKSRQVEKLKIDFQLAENKVAPIEGKKIYLRLIDESGQVIFDVAKGSGTILLDGKETFYTAMQEILYDNTRQKLSFQYEKGSEYAPGTYTVEAWCEGYLMGKETFVVK